MNKVYEGKDNRRMSEYVDNRRVNAKPFENKDLCGLYSCEGTKRRATLWWLSSPPGGLTHTSLDVYIK